MCHYCAPIDALQGFSASITKSIFDTLSRLHQHPELNATRFKLLHNLRQYLSRNRQGESVSISPEKVKRELLVEIEVEMLRVKNRVGSYEVEVEIATSGKEDRVSEQELKKASKKLAKVRERVTEADELLRDRKYQKRAVSGVLPKQERRPLPALPSRGEQKVGVQMSRVVSAPDYHPRTTRPPPIVNTAAIMTPAIVDTTRVAPYPIPARRSSLYKTATHAQPQSQPRRVSRSNAVKYRHNHIISHSSSTETSGSSPPQPLSIPELASSQSVEIFGHAGEPSKITILYGNFKETVSLKTKGKEPRRELEIASQKMIGMSLRNSKAQLKGNRRSCWSSDRT